MSGAVFGAVSVLACALAAAEGPPLPAVEATLVQRVLVVADEPSERLPRRVVDELSALGFDAVMRDDDDIIGSVGVVDAARNLGAVAAVELHGARVDLWADLWRAHPLEPHLYANAAHASFEASRDDVALSAVRIAEVVRARVIGASRARAASMQRHNSDAIDDVKAAPPSRPVAQLLVGAGPSGTWAGDAPARVGGALHALVHLPAVDVDVGARATLPLAAGVVDAAAGDAELWPFDALVTAGYRVPLDDDHLVAVTLGLAGGARWLRGRGVARGGVVVDGDVVSALAAADATLRFRMSGPLSLWASVEVGGAFPRPIVVVGERDVTAGPAYASIGAGLALTFPEDP